MVRKPIRSRGSQPAPPPEWATSLAATIRARRKALGLTQIQLADLAECGPVFVYALERGKPTLRLDKLIAVLDVLGMRLRIEAHKGGRPDAGR